MEEFEKRFEKLVYDVSAFTDHTIVRERAIEGKFYECLSQLSDPFVLGGRPNEKDRQRLETQLVRKIGDKDVSVSLQFAQEALLLSKLLDINENFAASLLAAASAEQNKFQLPPIYCSLFLYQTEKDFQYEFLKLLMRKGPKSLFIKKLESVLEKRFAAQKLSIFGVILAEYKATVKRQSTCKICDIESMASNTLARYASVTKGAKDGAETFLNQYTVLLEQLELHLACLIVECSASAFNLTDAAISDLLEIAIGGSLNSRTNNYIIMAGFAIINPYSAGASLYKDVVKKVMSEMAGKIEPQSAQVILKFAWMCNERHSMLPTAPRPLPRSGTGIRSLLESTHKGVFAEMYSVIAGLNAENGNSERQLLIPLTAVTDELAARSTSIVIAEILEIFIPKVLAQIPEIKDYFRYSSNSEDSSLAERDLGDMLDLCAVVFAKNGSMFWNSAVLLDLLKIASEKSSVELVAKSWRLAGTLMKTETAAFDATGKFFNVLSVSHSGSRSSKVSWEVLMRSISEIAGTSAQQWNEDELVVLQEGLVALAQLVSHSESERIRLFDRQWYRAGDRLLSLLLQPLPVQIKASVLNAVAAFALPTRETGSVMTESIWQFLVLNLSSLHTLGSERNGLLFDLEHIESSIGIYPATTAYLNLLRVLVGALTVGQSLAVSPWILDDLGQQASPHRSPWQSSVLFIVSYLIPSIHQRPYQSLEARWTFVGAVFETLETMLASYWHIATVTGNMGPGISQNPGFLVYEALLGTTVDRAPWTGFTNLLRIGVKEVNSFSGLDKCVGSCLSIAQLLAQLGLVHSQAQEKLRLWLNELYESGTDLLSTNSESHAALNANELLQMLERAVSRNVYNVYNLLSAEQQMLSTIAMYIDCVIPSSSVPERALSLLKVFSEQPGAAVQIVSALEKSSDAETIRAAVAFRLEQAAYDSVAVPFVVNTEINCVTAGRSHLISECLNGVDDFETILPLDIDLLPHVFLSSAGDRRARRLALALIELSIGAPIAFGVFFMGIAQVSVADDSSSQVFAGIKVVIKSLFDRDFCENDPVLAVYYWQLLAKFLSLPQLQSDVFAAINSQSTAAIGGISNLLPDALKLLFDHGEEKRSLTWYMLQTAYLLQCVQYELLFLAQTGRLGRLSELVAILFPTKTHMINGMNMLDLYHWLFSQEQHSCDSSVVAFTRDAQFLFSDTPIDSTLHDDIMKLRRSNAQKQLSLASSRLWTSWVTVTDLCLYAPSVLSNMSDDEMFRLSTGLLPVLLEQLRHPDTQLNTAIAQLLSQVVRLDRSASPKLWLHQCRDWALGVLSSRDSVLALRGWAYVTLLTLFNMSEAGSLTVSEDWLSVLVGDSLEASLPWRLVALSVLSSLLCLSSQDQRFDVVNYLVYVNALPTLLHNLDRDMQVARAGDGALSSLNAYELDQVLAKRLVEACLDLIRAVLSMPNVNVDRFSEFLLLPHVAQFRDLWSSSLLCVLAVGEQMPQKRGCEYYAQFLVAHSAEISSELSPVLPRLVAQELVAYSADKVLSPAEPFAFVQRISNLTSILRMCRAVVSYPNLSEALNSGLFRDIIEILTRHGTGWHSLFKSASQWIGMAHRWAGVQGSADILKCANIEGYSSVDEYVSVILKKSDTFSKLFLLYWADYREKNLQGNTAVFDSNALTESKGAFFSDFKF